MTIEIAAPPTEPSRAEVVSSTFSRFLWLEHHSNEYNNRNDSHLLLFEGFVIPESCALAAVVHRELGVKHKPASPTASLRTRRQRAHRISSFMSSFLLCDGCGLVGLTVKSVCVCWVVVESAPVPSRGRNERSRQITSVIKGTNNKPYI